MSEEGMEHAVQEALAREGIDEQVLASEGITDLDQYAFVPGAKKLLTDLFLD